MKKTINTIRDLDYGYRDDILHAAGLLHSDGYRFGKTMYDEIAFRLQIDYLVSIADWEAYMGVACRLGAMMYRVDDLMLRVHNEKDGPTTPLQDAIGENTIDEFQAMLGDYQYGW